MGVYNRDPVFPEWEPIPWDATGSKADEQERGFHQRALEPLVWSRVDWKNFPAGGIFGRPREWFVGHDIVCVATSESEELILIQNTWHGFPDPPEWGLGSRAKGSTTTEWKLWGHFANLPQAWTVPELG